MATIVLDSGAVSAFASADRRMREHVVQLARRNGDPFLVPTTVLIESITGSAARDATVNHLMRTCEIVPIVESLARRAAALRFASRRGSAVDASVVATAEARGGGVVITGDLEDLDALASQAVGVRVVPIPNVA